MNYKVQILILTGLPCFFVSTLVAQRNVNGLRLKKGTKGFYLEHKVASKQGLFFLGRLYNVHPSHLADYNSIDYDKGIQVDQVLRVPLSDTNFNRRDGYGVPITLLASTNDALNDMAKFVGVDPANMQCWNNYAGTEIKKGSLWVVGFLNTSEMPDQVVNFACPASEIPTANLPAATSNQINMPAGGAPLSTPKLAIESSTSFFESDYKEQIKKTPASQQLDLISAVFKTQSGWKDGKFYLLIDNLVPGTIVQLMNPSNSKVVFAKVLGEMPRIKQNEGLDMRISDAAAAVLELPVGGKFSLKVAY